MRNFILVIFWVAILSSGQVLADIIHVPSQYPTIQQGIDAAGPGDIVMVAPGRYEEEIRLKADVIVLGAGEGLSIIDGGGDAGDVVTAIGNNINNNTKFKGFTVTGAISGGSMPGGAGIFCNSGACPEISNNRVEENDQGIVVWNQSCAFIHNNVVINNTYSGISLSANAPVINNTIAYNLRGIYDGGGYGPTVMNNIVTSNTNDGIRAVGTQPVLTYNNVWGNGTNYNNCTPGIGSISENPLYQDTSIGNYHLQPGSPCIDTGNPLPEYNDPDGSRNDMGAYGGPGAAVDIPRIILTAPALNELNIPCSTNVSAVFNLAMDSSSFTSPAFRINGNISGPHSGMISYDSAAKTVAINPGTDFRRGELITAVLTKGIRSITGDSIEGFTWQFTAQVDMGSGRYSIPTSYNAGYAPNCVITGDFNFDNNLDLAVTDELSNRVSILLGDGTGEFDLVSNYLVGSEPHELITADFDNDSILDLAAANSGSDNVSILLGNGNGTFQPAMNFSAGDFADAIGKGDFNLDGNLDLAVANSNSNNISILLGNGDGSFNSPVHYSAGTRPSAVGIGDFDNNGFIDLAAANENSNNISILLGNGDGTFGTAVNYSTGNGPMSLCPGDFNEDGNLDLAVANNGANNLSVLLGNGNGTFGSAVNYPTGNSPRSIAAFDFDGDGSLDLVVANRGSNNISVFIGNGNGTFGAATNYPAGNSPNSVWAGDFDTDQDIDLCVANTTSDAVSILLNQDALEVISTNPVQNQLDVPKSTDITLTFNIPVNPTSLNDTSFIVYGAKSGLHSGAISYDSVTRTATFDPSSNFFDGELVTVLLTREIQATSGVKLRGFSLSFTVEITTSSNGTFNNRQDYSAGSEPRGMCAADFDADGDNDLAITNSDYPNPGQIAVLLNNGNGTFAAPAYYTVVQDPISVFAADLDTDEDIDLAVAHNEPGTSHLVILKNNGNAIFSLFATYAPAILGQAVSGGDFDSDGDIDLVMTDGWGSGNNVKIMLNNGNGSFSGPYTYSAGAGARGVIVKDVENDGDMDIIVANSSNDNVSVLLNRGNGTFPGLANYPVGDNPTSLYDNDLNEDGYIDIVTANYSGNDVTVILNNGDGTFSSPVSYPTGSYTRFITGGDFDGDSDIDLAVSANGADSIAVLLNNGDGTFSNAVPYDVGDSPWGIEAADFDLDGDLDLGCANHNTNDVTIWLNSGVGGLAEIRQTEILPFLRIRPNPFREKVVISYRISRSSDIRLRIFDAAGRLVTSHQLPVTSHCFVWDGRDNMSKAVSTGVYFFRLETDDYKKVEKGILSR